MKIWKFFLAGGLALLTAGLFLACNGDTGEIPTATPTPEKKAESRIALFDETGSYRYAVVRPDECSKDITKAAVSVRMGLAEKTGKEPEIKTDYVDRKDKSGSFADAYEILIGRTNRAESETVLAELGKNQYTVRALGNKIVIVGYDDVCTQLAVEKFLGALQTGCRAIPAEALFTATYSIEDGPINGRYYVKDIDGYYKTQGRTFRTENGLELLYTCCSFEFNAECSGTVSVVVYAENAQGGNWAVRFTGYVDGVRCEERYAIDGNGETEFVLAENLPAGKHTFALYRQTEWDRGDTYVRAVKMEGKLTAAPKDKDYYIEFIGDSLTSGFGNLDEIEDIEGEWGGAPIYQDGTQSYGFMVAEELDADCSIVAIQGIGVVCGPQTIVMGDVYPEFPLVGDKTYVYDFARKADLVVINMGTNDYENMGAKGKSKAEIMAAMKNLIEDARAYNDGAKVLVVTGMQPSFTTDLQQLTEELGGEAAGYYYLQLKQEMNGHDSHTSVSGHRANADLILTFLEEKGLY